MAYRERNDLDTRKGKSEVLESEETSAQTFVLPGKPLFQVAEAPNLVISLGLSGTTDKKHDQTRNKCQRSDPSTEIAGRICQRNIQFKGETNLRAFIQSG